MVLISSHFPFSISNLMEFLAPVLYLMTLLWAFSPKYNVALLIELEFTISFLDILASFKRLHNSILQKIFICSCKELPIIKKKKNSVNSEISPSESFTVTLQAFRHWFNSGKVRTPESTEFDISEKREKYKKIKYH